MSAYTFMSETGSEYGVGWNTARYMAEYHDVWVLIREDNRSPIEASLKEEPMHSLHFAYFDLPLVLLLAQPGTAATDHNLKRRE